MAANLRIINPSPEEEISIWSPRQVGESLAGIYRAWLPSRLGVGYEGYLVIETKKQGVIWVGIVDVHSYVLEVLESGDQVRIRYEGRVFSVVGCCYLEDYTFWKGGRRIR